VWQRAGGSDDLTIESARGAGFVEESPARARMAVELIGMLGHNRLAHDEVYVSAGGDRENFGS